MRTESPNAFRKANSEINLFRDGNSDRGRSLRRLSSKEEIKKENPKFAFFLSQDERKKVEFGNELERRRAHPREEGLIHVRRGSST